MPLLTYLERKMIVPRCRLGRLSLSLSIFGRHSKHTLRNIDETYLSALEILYENALYMPSRILTSTVLKGHWRLFVLFFFGYVC